MNDRLCNCLTVSAVALCSAWFTAPSAIAAPLDSVPISFNGTVSNMCVFGSPSGGTFGNISEPTQNYIRSDRGLGFGDATINLSCNGDVQVVASEVREVTTRTGMALNKAYNWPIVTASANNKSTSRYSNETVSNTMFLNGPVNQNITVNMNLLYSTAVKPGTYSYTTRLTATAQ
ncbi:MAG: hypothetical protein KME17_29190 [Cyanosarcina radialis HA8281-LM2]|nr:hypothetical protein [Cyanosarcina radialis HA8281-LM2]